MDKKVLIIIMLATLALSGCNKKEKREISEFEDLQTVEETTQAPNTETINPEQEEKDENIVNENVTENEEEKKKKEESEKKKKEQEEMKKVEEIKEKYKDVDYFEMLDIMTEEELELISCDIGWVQGYYANEDGTVIFSMSQYTSEDSFSIGRGYIYLYGQEMSGELEVVAKKKVKLAFGEINEDTWHIQENVIIIDFSNYEKDMSITVVVNDRLEYECVKILDYMMP